MDFDEERDLVRPEYEAQVDRERFNPATGKMESMMAPRDKFQRISLSIATVLFWVSLLCKCIVLGRWDQTSSTDGRIRLHSGSSNQRI